MRPFLSGRGQSSIRPFFAAAARALAGELLCGALVLLLPAGRTAGDPYARLSGQDGAVERRLDCVKARGSASVGCLEAEPDEVSVPDRRLRDVLPSRRQRGDTGLVGLDHVALEYTADLSVEGTGGQG